MAEVLLRFGERSVSREPGPQDRVADEGLPVGAQIRQVVDRNRGPSVLVFGPRAGRREFIKLAAAAVAAGALSPLWVGGHHRRCGLRRLVLRRRPRHRPARTAPPASSTLRVHLCGRPPGLRSAGDHRSTASTCRRRTEGDDPGGTAGRDRGRGLPGAVRERPADVRRRLPFGDRAVGRQPNRTLSALYAPHVSPVRFGST
ncbi:twin-arginine translocation signal domain-containing protein [Streptomyces sp. IMTB 2501]|uniref:twin-arginine translocation signal domain-containing protein n=1 Tax=Streptomyces sp. IMTB 2501 TaxID=1776340 RepID=UPI003532635F